LTAAFRRSDQADLAIAPSDPRRIYATVATLTGAGIYRSDDAGETWYQVTKDPRPARRIGGGDLPSPFVDPTNPRRRDLDDGGRVALDGRRQDMECAPRRPRRRRLPARVDQSRRSDEHSHDERSGAVVTVNGGRTWTSWYNQPTAQMYHVSTDNAFPYRVCGGQQESGSACVSSRGDDGAITMREWHPVGVEEYGYVAPDPCSTRRGVRRQGDALRRRTGQTREVGPKVFRSRDTTGCCGRWPLLFSPVDPPR
jgi:hypothetical protein